MRAGRATPIIGYLAPPALEDYPRVQEVHPDDSTDERDNLPYVRCRDEHASPGRVSDLCR